jgi:CubicO group peptidase (beta-lactamase class C family)
VKATPEEIVAAWGWPAAAGWVGHDVPADMAGAARRTFPWASVTKVVSSLAVWIAVEEGSVAWEDPVGPPGSTLRHLLAHASGLGPDHDRPLAPPGTRRIYSNRGIELAAEHLSRASSIPFGQYVDEAVLAPLGMNDTRLEGSPASGAAGPLTDLLRLASELLDPHLVAVTTLAQATSVAFPGLAGVLPGFGLQDPNEWGLGVEIRGLKEPHWTGRHNTPATFGHFGRSGSFLWVDPRAGRAAACLSDRPFGAWSATAWPHLSDAVLASGVAGTCFRDSRPAPSP